MIPLCVCVCVCVVCGVVYTAIEAMMQLQQPVTSGTAEEKNSVIRISGWATLVRTLH